MRQKFVFLTAIVVCLSLTLVPAMASEQTIDRHGDRTKAGKGVSSNGGVTPQYSTQAGDFLVGAPAYSAGNNQTSIRASSLLSAASKQEADVAITMLQQIVTMNLQSTEQNDQILSSAFEMLAGLYSGAPSKQVMNLGMALQYASDASRRTDLEGQITSLGGDVFTLAFNNNNGLNTYAKRDPGADDSCLGAAAVALPHSETMSITPAGDHNWRSFDLVGAPRDGAFLRIQTISDNPGSGEDDTDLALWNDCPENGGEQIAFNDDIIGDFTSRIDTDCLGPGTYYVEVGGFFDFSTPDNFDLEIEITGTCVVPVIDGFEPDDSPATAGDIGLPTPTSGNGWGRSHKEIQARSLVPRGDFDYVTFGLSQNSLVRMGTADQFPTFFNGFTGPNDLLAADTIMALFYQNEPNYGGRCNQSTNGFLPVCFTDADCPDPLIDPLPAFPDCIPLQAFGLVADFNPIATNDDRGSGDFGSELLMCLPRTGSGGGSGTLQAVGGEWMVEVSPWRPTGTTNFIDPFDYELQVKNEVGCLYEQEPNGDCCFPYDSRGPAQEYEIGTTISGMWDFSVANPYADSDHFVFDVEETTFLLFSTDAPEPGVSDTFLELIVGPDDEGDFFFAGVSDDNGGVGGLSSVAADLPPANELLGNELTNDARYIMRVRSRFISANWPYEFSAVVSTPPVVEVEPNDTEATAQAIEIGNTVIAAIDEDGCDYDVYSFTLTENTFVTLEETSGGDATMQITDCSGNVAGCDDDSGGPGFLFLIDGCLPAGTWCAQVRAFDPALGFDYVLETSGTAGCTPDSPPTMNGDNGFNCTDFDTCP